MQIGSNRKPKKFTFTPPMHKTPESGFQHAANSTLRPEAIHRVCIACIAVHVAWQLVIVMSSGIPSMVSARGTRWTCWAREQVQITRAGICSSTWGKVGSARHPPTDPGSGQAPGERGRTQGTPLPRPPGHTDLKRKPERDARPKHVFPFRQLGDKEWAGCGGGATRAQESMKKSDRWPRDTGGGGVTPDGARGDGVDVVRCVVDGVPGSARSQRSHRQSPPSRTTYPPHPVLSPPFVARKPFL